MTRRKPPETPAPGYLLLQARDRPASCVCDWELRHGPPRWVRTSLARGCPWHLAEAPVRCCWCGLVIERCDPAPLGWFHVIADSRWCRNDGDWKEATP